MVNRELDQGVKDQIAHRCFDKEDAEQIIKKADELKKAERLRIAERRWRIEEHQRKLRVSDEEWEL